MYSIRVYHLLFCLRKLNDNERFKFITITVYFLYNIHVHIVQQKYICYLVLLDISEFLSRPRITFTTQTILLVVRQNQFCIILLEI